MIETQASALEDIMCGERLQRRKSWLRLGCSAFVGVGLALAGCDAGGADADGGSTDAAATPDATAVPDASLGPTYKAFLSVERWARLDPMAMHTMAAYQPFFLDERLPRYVQVDEYCGYHEEDWRLPDRPMPSFGTVTMHTPVLGEVTWELPNGYGTPDGQWGWDTGDTVHVTALGGDLPAFDIEDVVPAQSILTTYDLFTAHPLDITIARDAPLTLDWNTTGSEPQVLALFLQFDDASYLPHGIWCLFPAAPGTAQVSKEVLSHLVPTTQVTNTNFYFGGASSKHLQLQGVDLEMLTWKAQAARVRIQ